MKIICIGRNYETHITELGNEKPKEPVFFLKPDSAILPKKMPFFIPSFTNEVHYEVEVLVKINKVGKHISQNLHINIMMKLVLELILQQEMYKDCKEKGLPWEKAKAFDGSAVVGAFYPKDEFDIANLKFQLYQNETIVQDGNTNAMLWKIDELIAYVSQYFTLKKGDIIFTGTPAGVGKVFENDVLKGVIAGKEAFTIRVK